MKAEYTRHDSIKSCPAEGGPTFITAGYRPFLHPWQSSREDIINTIRISVIAFAQAGSTVVDEAGIFDQVIRACIAKILIAES